MLLALNDEAWWLVDEDHLGELPVEELGLHVHVVDAPILAASASRRRGLHPSHQCKDFLEVDAPSARSP